MNGAAGGAGRDAEDTRQKGALRGCREGGKRKWKRIGTRGQSAEGDRGDKEESRENCGKETAADRFVKPPRRKKTRRAPDNTTPRVRASSRLASAC